ncbi:DUF4240 domain-containing protein [Exilibacterium tricleocarpae]|uniref:DUF4240 domain-containing protein n=1 Tax=Exilibacterium tricleocarpae TaxID=2591008 RepID=A0A545TYY7_9GAMM|nr:DUF4240 domain-containing protein [Exilibacterium tricleocarpae]TQV82414.1 DUF4240 domain-containing protein [Exilibacterium tricleocarpae]
MSYAFWGLVEAAKSAAGATWEDRPATLKRVLLAQSPETIRQFNKDYHDKLAQAYRWDLWGAAYLINGGCSDDGFDYFRDFLISEGKTIFEAALDSPDSLAAQDYIDGTELESYRYAISSAYEELTDSKIPDDGLNYPTDPAGQEWDEDDLEQLFPKLGAKYG